MRISEVKDILTDVVQDFFYTATVVWANEVSEKPPLPLITLRTGLIKKAKYPKDNYQGKDGYIEEYDAVMKLEVKGYTTGLVEPSDERNMIQTAENSALEDMMQFDDYMTSTGLTDVLSAKDISIDRIGDVNDTTIQTATSRAEYSAMVEYDISFTLTTHGRYGITESERNSMIKTNNESLLEETGYFESVNIEGTTE